MFKFANINNKNLYHGKKENNEGIPSTVKKNMFLRQVVTEVEHTKELAPDIVNRLKNIFSKKKFDGIEKCSYEVVIALGMSGNPELRLLASEFNVILNNACK